MHLDFFKYFPDMAEGYSLTQIEKLMPLITCVVLLIVMYFIKDKVSADSKQKIIKSLGFLLFLSELGNLLTLYSHFGFSINLISLHLCTVSAAFSIYMIFFNQNRELFGVWFFWALQGAIQALMSPTVTVGIFNFKYWQFYTTHILLIVIPITVIYFMDYIPTFKDIKISYLYLLVLGAFAMIYNTIYGTDFMFVAFSGDVRPITGSPLDLLGPFPFYIFALLILSFVLLSITYIPVNLSIIDSLELIRQRS